MSHSPEASTHTEYAEKLIKIGGISVTTRDGGTYSAAFTLSQLTTADQKNPIAICSITKYIGDPLFGSIARIDAAKGDFTRVPSLSAPSDSIIFQQESATDVVHSKLNLKELSDNGLLPATIEEMYNAATTQGVSAVHELLMQFPYALVVLPALEQAIRMRILENRDGSLVPLLGAGVGFVYTVDKLQEMERERINSRLKK